MGEGTVCAGRISDRSLVLLIADLLFDHRQLTQLLWASDSLGFFFFFLLFLAAPMAHGGSPARG